MIFVEAIGWAGAVLILGAYLLLSMGRIAANSVTFQALNVIGAAGFVVNGWAHGALPSVTLNVIWMAIGAVALWRILRGRKPR